MRPITLGPFDGELIDIGPTSTRVLVTGADSDDRLGLVEMHIAPGFGGPPPHRHRELHHVWYVLAGTARLTVEGEASDVDPGSCLLVPAGVGHTFANVSTTTVRLLQVDTPRPLDGYFRELAQAFPPGTEVDPEVTGEIMRRHDTWPLAAAGS